MNRLFLFRFSIIKLKGIFNKKFNFILNFAIFLTLFAITASSISIYYENKIEKLEIKITRDEIKHIVFTKWLNRTPKLISDINNIFHTRKSATLFAPIIKYFPDDDVHPDSSSAIIYGTRDEFYKYYFFILGALKSNFLSMELILQDSEFLVAGEKDIQSIKKQNEFYENLFKEALFLQKESKNYRSQKKEIRESLEKLNENPQNYYIKYEEFTRKAKEILIKQRDFYLNFSLNYFSNKRSQFNENNSKTLTEIVNIAKLESRLIFFAFIVQFFIFIVLQIFEITLERENQKKRKK